MSKRDVTYTILVADKASAGFRKIAEGSRKARREVEKLETAADVAGDTIDDALSGDSVESLTEELDKAKRKTRELGEEAKESGRGFGGLAKEARSLVKVLAAAEVTKFFVKQGKSAVEASSQIETYQATLETMLGSTQAARDRLEEYKDIAKITPFGLSDVAEAGNQLQAIGRYSRGNLEMLGDLAAATNKPMEQVMNAYAKLATGQKGEASRMFQDLLISRNDWMAATGKGVSKSGELLATTEEMMAALPKIMSSKGFYGMMAKQAETAAGKASNLQDAVFGLRAAIGERMSPAVKGVTGSLTKMAESMEEAVKVPLAEKIAQEKVELNLLVGALERSWEKESDRERIISDLNSKYPDFLKNVNLEKDGLEGVRAKLVEVNKEYDRRIKLSMAASALEKWQEKYDDARQDLQNEENARWARKRREEIAKATSGRSNLLNVRKDRSGKWVADVFSANQDNAEGSLNMETISLSGMDDALAQEYNALAKYARGTHSDAYTEKRKKRMEEAQREQELIKKMYGITDDNQSGDAGSNGQNGVNGQNGQNGTNGTTNGTTTVGGTTYSGGGSGSGSGGSGKTVTTHIGTLVGTIEIHTTTLQEGAEEVKRLVTQALLEAVPGEL